MGRGGGLTVKSTADERGTGRSLTWVELEVAAYGMDVKSLVIQLEVEALARLVH